MMKAAMNVPTRARRVAAAVALVFAGPCGVGAAQVAAKIVMLQTSDVDIDRNLGGAAQGSLRLTIGSDGNIIGYFRTVDRARYVDVHGALTGTKIYLDIGSDNPIEGTYTDGKLDAYTLEGLDRHHFTAVTAPIERS